MHRMILPIRQYRIPAVIFRSRKLDQFHRGKAACSGSCDFPIKTQTEEGRSTVIPENRVCIQCLILFFFNDFTISSYIPLLDLGYESGVRMMMLTSGFSFLFYVLYFTNLIKFLSPSTRIVIIRNVFLLIAGLHMLLAFFLKIEAGIMITSLYEIIGYPIGMLLILMELFLIRKSKGMWLMLAGYMLFLIFAVTDIVVRNFFLDDFSIIPWGIIILSVFVVLYSIYRQSSGFPHHERKESDVFQLFLRNNVENHFLCSTNQENLLKNRRFS